MPCRNDDGVGPGLPGPRTAAALVLGVLAFGVVLGNAAGPAATAVGAGGRANLTILVAAPASAPAVPVATPVVVAPEPPAGEGDTAVLDDTSSTEDTTSTVDATSSDDTGDATPATDGASTDDRSTDDSAKTPVAKLPPVKHVWVVALTGHSYDESFGAGASTGSYLSTTLRAQGTLLPWYHAAGQDPAAGGVALLGGQKDALGPFDDKTVTLADQLTGAGRTWKAYVEGATAGLAPGDNPCARPPEQQPRNPFLRFASITGTAECGSSIAEPDRIAPDAADTDSAPAFSSILPGPAHDGSTSLVDADAWLATMLPPLLASKAYNDGGLVVVTFDAGAPGDVEAGGGRVGALLLSPFVTPGGTIGAPYDPFALLASIEGLFGLDPIGYAKDTKLKPFGPKVYGAWSPATDTGS
jgi:phosphatidylinositol-3-phosphatase